MSSRDNKPSTSTDSKDEDKSNTKSKDQVEIDDTDCVTNTFSDNALIVCFLLIPRKTQQNF